MLLALAIFYAGMCLLVFVFQRKLLYLPVIRSSAEVNQLAHDANMERWTNSAGQFIGMKRIVTNQPAAGTILMCYGNASSAVHCSVYAEVIQQVTPLDFYVLEYPGYEDRAGSPSKDDLIAAGTEAFQSLPTNQPVFLIGESLGTGVSSYLAGKFSASFCFRLMTAWRMSLKTIIPCSPLAGFCRMIFDRQIICAHSMEKSAS